MLTTIVKVTPAELVLAQFPGRVYITLVEAGAAIGMKPQTCYNLRVKNQFPLPVRLIRRKPMVALVDLISYMETGMNHFPKEVSAGRKVGRPRNADRSVT